MTEFLTTSQGRRIAFDRQAGQGPGIVFLGGFRSDMTGTKAAFLADWARARGRAFLRFDYSGHGASGGDFLALGIADWFDDALQVIGRLTDGPQVLVGSSMGGWMALLVARARPDRVKGLVGIAAAPDFTERMTAALTPAQAADLDRQGVFTQASDYDPAGYPITRALLDQGARSLVLQTPLSLPFPVRLLHGTADSDVPQDVALRLLAQAASPDLRLTLVKDADHRFSTPACLDLIAQAVDDVSA
jgi:pimeloyl-ACP methyl ester carboxylesterase